MSFENLSRDDDNAFFMITVSYQMAFEFQSSVSVFVTDNISIGFLKAYKLIENSQ